MCQAIKDGGERCATHHQKQYFDALKKMRETPSNSPQIFAVKQEMLNEAIEYAATKSGLKYFEEKRNELLSEGKNCRTYQLIIDSGIRRREVLDGINNDIVPIKDYRQCNQTIHNGKHQTIKGRKLDLLPHSIKMAKEKGFTPDQIRRLYTNPERVYPSNSHPGQYRITGQGLCLVGEPSEDGKTFKVVTMYADRILTRPRRDQLNTVEGRDFANKYASGQVDRKV